MKAPRNKLLFVLAGMSLASGICLALVIKHQQDDQFILTSHRPVGGITSQQLHATIQDGLTLSRGSQQFFINQATVSSWFSPYFRDYTHQQEVLPQTEVIKKFLTSLAPSINRKPKNARLGYVNNQIQEVIPSQDGQQLDIDQTTSNILASIKNNKNGSDLAINLAPATISLQRMQQLNITKLIGVGTSQFIGSTASRIHNIHQGASLFDGAIVASGSDFSFNTILGDVNASTGYLPELVIKNKTVVPEYGGGLCQVSTTLFRAAMASGLSILERHAHSFPVHYYNPQGYDATIYPGSADLRFKNDTASPLIIQTEIIGTQLTFEIYGNDDNRQVTIDGPKIYQSNPDGSMKTVLKKTIVYNDNHKDVQTFYSNYQSPASFPLVKNPLE